MAPTAWFTSHIFKESLSLTSEFLLESSLNLKDQEPKVPSIAGSWYLFLFQHAYLYVSGLSSPGVILIVRNLAEVPLYVLRKQLWLTT